MRQSDLLRGVAKDLQEGNMALNHTFLTENFVTFDEAGSTADQLAVGAAFVAYALENPKSEAFAQYVATLMRMT